MSTDLPTYEALYAFLKAHYRHECFEGRNKTNGPGYSNDIAHAYLDALAVVGQATIPKHESASGEPVVFDSSLKILESA